MAFKHGKDTVVKLGDADLSPFTTSTDFNQEADAVETTTYGRASKTYIPGLKAGKITLKGNYDDGVDGPAEVIEPLLATVQSFTFQPEGTGVGKRQKVVDAVVTAFNTSSPVAEQIQWTMELQASDDVDYTVQA